METRECSKCHQVLPFDQANFKPDKKGKVGTDGTRLSSVCRPCDNERIRLREGQRKAAGAMGAPSAMGATVTPGATGAPSAPGVMSATGAMGAPGAPEPAKRVRAEKATPAFSAGAPGAPKGRKSPHEDFTKHGFIIRRVYLERLRAEAWQHRQDITQALDRILAEHFRRT